MTHHLDREAIRSLAAQQAPAMLDFARRLIQTPSLPGEEQDVADLTMSEMQGLGYDDVQRDHAGNVIGLMRGQAREPALLLNSHLDHVDSGDAARWPFPPYAAETHDGFLWGRGASDVKGPFAVQVHAVAALKRAGVPLPSDVYVVGVVMEEVGGLGTVELLTQLRPHWAILAEPTGNTLARGHRGRIEIILTITGRSAHASVPQRGVNPHYAAARFLQRLETMPMRSDPVLGAATVAPTLYLTDQRSPNVIPGRVELHLDWRNVAAETEDAVLSSLSSLMAEAAQDVQWNLAVEQRVLQAYTGFSRGMKTIHPSYLLPEEHPLPRRAAQIIGGVVGRALPIGIWCFATDGGHLMAAGIPTIGYSPGDEAVVHTTEERISIALMEEALAGYIALCAQLGGADG